MKYSINLHLFFDLINGLDNMIVIFGIYVVYVCMLCLFIVRDDVV